MQLPIFQSAAQSAEFLGAVLNAMPHPVLIVDDDVRILYVNAAAARVFGGKTPVLKRRGGEALHCVHSTETPGGCGTAPACRDCVIRNSVREAYVGKQVCRKAQRMQLIVENRTTEVNFLVTTAPFNHNGESMVLLVLEDVSELVNLRRIVPVCAGCRKIRDDQRYWQQVDLYLARHLNMNVTHGICPECAARLYPEFANNETEPE
jgi:PAS domain-containing protein